MQVASEDHGRWTCLVNDIVDFNARKTFVTLHIGVEAKMGINVHGGDIQGWDPPAGGWCGC